jgi:sulfofructosephosphate aldolase
VPFDGVGPAKAITDACEEITGLLSCPWVVLSSGVTIEAFPAAVEAACQGGASGFLAGRAVWRDALGDDPARLLRERSVPRLVELASIVDREARPWHLAG